MNARRVWGAGGRGGIRFLSGSGTSPSIAELHHCSDCCILGVVVLRERTALKKPETRAGLFTRPLSNKVSAFAANVIARCMNRAVSFRQSSSFVAYY